MAVLQDSNVLVQSSWTGPSSHTSRIPFELQNLLAQAGFSLSDIDLFAVTHGPGSFTGVRVGLAFIKGLALSLKKPAMGVSTLKSLAMQDSPLKLSAPFLDAYRGEIFAALYQRSESGLCLIMEERAQAPRDFLNLLLTSLSPEEPVQLIGSGVSKYVREIREIFGSHPYELDENSTGISAADVGQLAYKDFLQLKVEEISSQALTPQYLRAPEAQQRLTK